MKKFILFALFLISAFGASAAADKVVYSESPLPTQSKELLSKHFKAKVNFIKIDNDVLGRVSDYKAVLTDGTEVEFDAAGNLKAVEAGMNGVPKSLILPAISKYIKDNCKNQKVLELEINKKYYKVQLLDGRELKFDRNGTFISEER